MVMDINTDINTETNIFKTDTVLPFIIKFPPFYFFIYLTV
jgi:hypothetical protein